MGLPTLPKLFLTLTPPATVISPGLSNVTMPIWTKPLCSLPMACESG